jgi:hypothetical protein
MRATRLKANDSVSITLRFHHLLELIDSEEANTNHRYPTGHPFACGRAAFPNLLPNLLYGCQFFPAPYGKSTRNTIITICSVFGLADSYVAA